jgi:hypothetical protein
MAGALAREAQTIVGPDAGTFRTVPVVGLLRRSDEKVQGAPERTFSYRNEAPPQKPNVLDNFS